MQSNLSEKEELYKLKTYLSVLNRYDKERVKFSLKQIVTFELLLSDKINNLFDLSWEILPRYLKYFHKYYPDSNCTTAYKLKFMSKIINNEIDILNKSILRNIDSLNKCFVYSLDTGLFERINNRDYHCYNFQSYSKTKIEIAYEMYVEKFFETSSDFTKIVETVMSNIDGKCYFNIDTNKFVSVIDRMKYSNDKYRVISNNKNRYNVLIIYLKFLSKSTVTTKICYCCKNNLRENFGTIPFYEEESDKMTNYSICDSCELLD